MKLYALLPEKYLETAKEFRVEFQMKASLGKNDFGEMTLILTVKDEKGKTTNGSQFIGEIE